LWGCYGGCFGAVLGLFCGCFGAAVGLFRGCFVAVSGLLWGCFGAAVGTKTEGCWLLEMRTKIEEGWGLWWLGSARIGGGKRRSKVVVLDCTRRRKMRVFGWDFGQKMDKTKWGW
jgi:hypothetical protein